MMDWQGRHTFNFPTRIRFGCGVIGELGPHLKGLGFRRPLVVTDPGLSRLKLLERVLDLLRETGLEPQVYDGIHKNPVKSDVELGAGRFREAGADSLIGIGGGASLDVARAIAFRIFHPGDFDDYEDARGGSERITGEIPYFVAVPTTSGTGSEVGRSAVISDDVTHQKKILFSSRLMAQTVFSDPELTFELPKNMTAATGMDALTHNLEAYLAKGFHPLCDGIALEGIRIIARHLPRAVNRPDPESRTMMMAAAMMGAVAFQKGLGVVHSTAHPLSTRFDMHHGLANAVMISYGVEFNAGACEARLAKIAESAGLGEQTPRAVVNWLRDLNRELGLPLKLQGLGVEESHLGELADLALADFCHALNPRPVTRGDFLDIYRRAL